MPGTWRWQTSRRPDSIPPDDRRPSCRRPSCSPLPIYPPHYNTGMAPGAAEELAASPARRTDPLRQLLASVQAVTDKRARIPSLFSSSRASWRAPLCPPPPFTILSVRRPPGPPAGALLPAGACGGGARVLPRLPTPPRHGGRTLVQRNSSSCTCNCDPCAALRHRAGRLPAMFRPLRQRRVGASAVAGGCYGALLPGAYDSIAGQVVFQARTLSVVDSICRISSQCRRHRHSRLVVAATPEWLPLYRSPPPTSPTTGV